MTGGAASKAPTCQASCMLLSQQASTVLGTLRLTQDETNKVTITGTLTNVPKGPHGLSVCVAGDLSETANSCGPIFNPFGKTHGGPSDGQRMVGDLGNITADESGTAVVDVTDAVVSLVGPHSIIGRSLVLFASEDDQGRGGQENSLTTGNAGPRIAAGVVGIVV